MLTVFAIIGVLVLAVAGAAYERRCQRRIDAAMDKMMGRDQNLDPK